MIETKMLGIDDADLIVNDWLVGTHGIFIDPERRSEYPGIPLAFRSLTRRKLIYKLWKENRDFYYIDTGYIGNLGKRKEYHRIVKNNVQHLTGIKDVPADRYLDICKIKPYMQYRGRKNLNGIPILIVTPSEKPCKFYNIDRDIWVQETIQQIKTYTDRPIIIRDKPLRRERIGEGSIYQQFKEENVWALVTYNSIAAIEALHYGIPAFTLAPNAAQFLASDDLSTIEKPFYPTEDKVFKFLHYLSYCQYTPVEMRDGTAMSIQKDFGL